MAYDETLADRVRALVYRERDAAERKMFGGLCFLVAGNMCCGVMGDGLIVRIPKERHAALLREAHVGPFDFTGRPMSGFLVVRTEGLAGRKLASWVGMGLDIARSLPAKGTARGPKGRKRKSRRPPNSS